MGHRPSLSDDFHLVPNDKPGSLSQFQTNRLEYESTFADIRPPPHVRHSYLHVQAIRLGSHLSWLPFLWRYPPRSHDATHSKSSKSQTMRIFSQIDPKTPANNPGKTSQQRSEIN